MSDFKDLIGIELLYMPARELGHMMYSYTLYDCIVESLQCSNCEQWAKHK